MSAGDFDKDLQAEGLEAGDSGRRLAAELEGGVEEEKSSTDKLFKAAEKAGEEVRAVAREKLVQELRDRGELGDDEGLGESFPDSFPVYFTPDLGRQGVQVGEVDQVELEALVPRGEGQIIIGAKLFRDGSPFVFDTDMDDAGSPESYDIVLSADQPSFVALYSSAEEGYPNRHPLSDQDCESLAALLADPKLRDIDNIELTSL